MEPETNLEEDGSALDHSSTNQTVEQWHVDQDTSSRREIEEEVIEQETKAVEDGKAVNHSSVNQSVEQWHVSKDKKVFISPQVQHALNILNNVISLVREGGVAIQTWSGLDSTNQQLVNLENVAIDGSSSSHDSSDGGICHEVPQMGSTKKALDGAENCHALRSTYIPDSPKREVNHSLSVVSTSVLEQDSLTSKEQNKLSLKSAEGDASFDRSQNGAVENLSVLSKISKDKEEVSVKVNNIHEKDANVNVNGEDQKLKQKKKKKKHRYCCFHFTPPGQ